MTDDKIDRRPAKDLSDHDLLIRIDMRTDKVETCLNNHLSHHWAVEIGLVLLLASAVIALVVSLLTGAGG